MIRTNKSKGANVIYDFVGLSTVPQPKVENFGELMFHYDTGVEYIATKEGWKPYRLYKVGADASKGTPAVDGAMYVAPDTATNYIGLGGVWKPQ